MAPIPPPLFFSSRHALIAPHVNEARLPAPVFRSVATCGPSAMSSSHGLNSYQVPTSKAPSPISTVGLPSAFSAHAGLRSDDTAAIPGQPTGSSRSATPGKRPRTEREPTQASAHQANWGRVWVLWEAVVLYLTPFSCTLREMAGSLQAPAIQQALLSRISDVTAVRYLTVTLQFCSAAEDSALDLGSLTAAKIVDLLFMLRSDPGCKAHATNSLKALRWVTKLLQLPWPSQSRVFQLFDSVRGSPRRESLPLPISFICYLERALRDPANGLVFRAMCGSFLFMITASLR